ncbi:MAG TPA: glycosyltransferase family 39 protein [Streptosporangiaceae bacterium]|nr:glycosyltransferase family 39 protein [Streptosporangiaceae bacterium]
MPSGWPLLPVLIVQALLSLRLVWADTAYQDEAQALWAGHLQWANWLHGTPIPPLPYYLSGAPVIYPPLGALADHAGGLTAARVLSLVFMLAATTLLWSAARRLYGRRAAFFAAALFAVLGPTLHLGAFANYDALSLVFVALAAWCVLRVGDRGEAPGRMIAAGTALALANATSYSTILFDVLVPVLAVLAVVPAMGGRIALRRVAILLTTLIAFLAAGLLIGGSIYLIGLKRFILAPVAHTNSPLSVLSSTWYWAGVLVVLAVAGVVFSALRREGRAQTWLLAVLAAAAILGPAEQAWLHTAALLNEHVGVGAWFAAIAAGYAVDRFIAAAPAGRQQAFTSATCVIALVFPVYLGAVQSWSFATSWPNAKAFIAVFRPLADHGHGRMLVEDPSIAKYYLPAGREWRRWSSTRTITLPSGASTGNAVATAGIVAAGNAATFAKYIAKGYFSYVALNFADTSALDHGLATLLHRNPHYHTIQVVPYGIEVPPFGQGTYVIWKYER